MRSRSICGREHTRYPLLAHAFSHLQPLAGRVQHRTIVHDSEMIDARQYDDLCLGINALEQRPIRIGIVLLIVGTDNDESVSTECREVVLILETWMHRAVQPVRIDEGLGAVAKI